MAHRNSNPRIMHVITGLTTGGAEMMLLKLLSVIKGQYHQEVVSLMDEGTVGPRIKALGINVHSLGLRSAVPNPWRALSIRSLMRQFRPQLIQGWMYHGSLMASFAGISSGRPPVLWNIRQSLDDVTAFGRLTSNVIRLGALLSRHPAAIIYNSQSGARQHEAFGYHTEKQVIIPNGFDCQTFHPDEGARRQVRTELGVSDDTILVGLVARYHSMKDHAGFLKAAGLALRDHPEARFLLAGKGVNREEAALLKVIVEQQLQARTFLLGERSDVPRLTAALDVACSASAWGEGFSNSLGEAMSCGIPCVATDVGDSAQIVADTGLTVPPRDPQAFAQAINRLISVGVARRRELGAAARRRVEDKFSLPIIAHQYDEVYREYLLSPS